MGTDVLRIIERIYAAVAEPAALGLLAAQIAPEFGAESTFLYTAEDSRQRGRAINKDLLSATANFDHRAHVSYTNYYLERDEWARHIIKRPEPNVVTDQELLSRSAFAKSEVYADYFRKMGIFHGLGGVFPVRDHDYGIVVIHRPQKDDEFGRDERALMGQLLPHLQRAFQIHLRINAIERGRILTTEVLERLSLGAIIVDGNARIVFANVLASRLLQSGEGLTVRRGLLRARLPAEQAMLEKVIGTAAMTSIGRATHAGGLLTVSRAAGSPLSVLVSPFRATAIERADQQSVLVLISDPDTRERIPEQVLAKAYRLSLAEARLLSALVAGKTIAEYAEEARVTLNTAKTQMRDIFFKTGYHRQADIIRAVLADPLLKIQSANALAAPEP